MCDRELITFVFYTMTMVIKQDMESFRRKQAFSQQFVIKEKMRGVLPCVTGH